MRRGKSEFLIVFVKKLLKLIIVTVRKTSLDSSYIYLGRILSILKIILHSSAFG